MSSQLNVEHMVIDLVAEDNDIIPYRKSLRGLAGSVTATILLQQIIWRGKRAGWEPFYKFRAPCNHELYKEGDSWTEELGFSVEEFDAAIKRIGTKITKGAKKSDALAIEDKKSLVIYWTDTNRVTWYQLNRNLLGKLLLPIYLVNGETQSDRKVVEPDLPIGSETTSTETPTDHQQHDDGNDDEAPALILKTLAYELVEELPEWTGPNQFLDGLDPPNLSAAVSWLWLWALLGDASEPDPRDQPAFRYPFNPFDGVKNIPGKIITQSRLGNRAPLQPVDAENLRLYIAQLRELPDMGDVALQEGAAS